MFLNQTYFCRLGATALLLATLGHGASATAAPLTGSYIMSLEFKQKAKASCSVAADRISARLEITGLSPADIAALGKSRKAGPYQVVLRHELGDVVVGVIMGRKGLVRCRVLLEGKRPRVLIGTEDRRQFRAQITKSLLEPLPVTYDTTASKRLKNVRALLRQRAYAKAIKALTKLRRRAHLRDYIALRRADIHMLAGRVPTAYVKYKNVQELMSTRNMRLLARTRAAEVAYLVDGVVPPALLIRSLQRPAPKLGQYSRMRLVEVLTRAGMLQEAMSLTRIHPADSARTLNNQLVLAMMRRHLLRGRAYEAALAYLRIRRKLPKTEARAEVLLMAGQAYMELDLAKDAAKVLQQSLTARKDARHRERVLALLAQAYQGSKQYYRARQTTDYYTATFKKKAPRYAAMVELRAGLKLREGDINGAREDLARLKPEQAPALRKLLKAKAGMADVSRLRALSGARGRQDDIRKKMEGKR